MIPGFAFKSSDLADSGIPVVKIGSITGAGAVKLESGQFLPEPLVEERHEKFFLNNGDVVLAMTGEGKVGRVRGDQRCLLNQRVCKLEPLEPDDGQYLWVAVRTIDYARVFAQLAQGAAQANISGSQLESLQIPWPQKRVRARIAEIVAAYDDLIDNNRRRMALLEEAARQLYREWFVRLRFPGQEHTRITNGVQEGWERRRLGECSRFLSGGTPSKARSEFWEGDVPWVSSGELTSFRIHRTSLSVTPEAVEAGSRLVPAETILAVVRGMSLAKEFRIGLTSAPMSFNQDLKAIIPSPDVDGLFLFHALDSLRDQIRDKAGEAAHGTKKLDSAVLSGVEIFVPPKTLQRLYRDQVQPLHAQWDILDEQNCRLKSSRDLLLPRLMSGEIAV